MKTEIQALLIVLIFSFISCQNHKKLESSDQSAVLLKAADIALNDIAIEGVFQEANQEANFYAGSEHLLRQIAKSKGKNADLLADRKELLNNYGQTSEVSIDTAAAGYPVKITVVHNSVNANNHGRLVAGTVRIELSGERYAKGSTCKISYINCIVDSTRINGTSTETFSGSNIIDRKMTDSNHVTFTMADGTLIDRAGKNVCQWLNGLDTPKNRNDDMIEVTGSINVKSSAGIYYSRLITKPLINIGDCLHYVEGTVTFSQNNKVISELDYGDGKCDNLAKLTTGVGKRVHWLFEDEVNDLASLKIRNQTVEIDLKGNQPKVNLKGHGNERNNMMARF
jgi:hypothetical protein